jgi:hypothetical protein
MRSAAGFVLIAAAHSCRNKIAPISSRTAPLRPADKYLMQENGDCCAEADLVAHEVGRADGEAVREVVGKVGDKVEVASHLPNAIIIIVVDVKLAVG